MPGPSARTFMRVALILSSYVFLVGLVVLFGTGAYRWALQIGRVPALSINPVMYPLFTDMNVSVVDGNVELGYRLFRTYDYYADSFASPRRHGRVVRVPVMYVHGNAGSYWCARSLARFLYEANANLRVTAHKNFLPDVKNRVVQTMQEDDSWKSFGEGQVIPRSVQQQAEAFVVRTSHPILATELFSVDFLEESFTQSGVLTIKTARFLNHSLHVLMHEFLRAHQATLDAPVSPIFDADALLVGDGAAADVVDDGAHADNATARRDPRREALDLFSQQLKGSKTLRKVRDEYAASLCVGSDSHGKGSHHDTAFCEQAQSHLERFSVQERVRDEVMRTRDAGIWIWGESLGGTLGILAALLNPDLVAGVVLVASPVHYQPLFFDVASTWLFRSISDATRRAYLLLSQTPALTKADWDSQVLRHSSPVELIRSLSSVAPVELAARLANVTLLAINGGALDDVVPSISGALQRSFPRVRVGAPYEALLMSPSADRAATLRKRRDISTEVMRWCGWPMDHRGLVYSLQFLQASASSLASAALLPNASDFFYRDDWLPDTPRSRLFPSVVETLTSSSGQHAADRAFDVSSLKPTGSGRLMKSRMLDDLMDDFEEVCVSSTSRPLDINNFTVFDEADNSGFFNGSKMLSVLLGYTTLPDDKIKSATLTFYRDPGLSAIVSEMEVASGVATRLHLPVLQKGSQATPGLVLRTVYSFTPRRRVKRRMQPQYAYPQFCLLVDNRDADLLERHHTYVQGTHIDVAAFTAAAATTTPKLIGNALQVEHYQSHVLMAGVGSTTLETDLHVRTHPDAAVYPFTFCGSMHAFYVALRGEGTSAVGDPDAQLQLFFGAYQEKQVTHDFHYQWKPFSTHGATHNEVYMCYVIGDNAVSPPSVEPRELTRLANAATASALPSWEGIAHWWTRVWPGRWLAHFSLYTGIARCGASSVLLFFQVYMLCGWMRRRFCSNPQLVAQCDRGFLRGVSRSLTPLWALFGIALVMEVVSGAVADVGLRVCRDASANPMLTDAQRTAQMGLLEKITLLALWLKPNYQECQYSWIQIQAVPVWGNLMEHMATIYIGFVVAVILIVLIMGIVQLLCGVVGAPLAWGLVRPLVRRVPAVGSLWLVAMWALPTVVLVCVPGMPLCYVELGAAVLAQIVIWSIPRSLAPGYHFWWPCIELCTACWFPAHFDGLVLTVRNHVMLRDAPELFWDPERYLLTTHQKIVFACLQVALAAVYCTTFCSIRAAHTLELAAAKKTQEANSASEAVTAGKQRKSSDSKDVQRATAKGHEDACDYVVGAFGRRFPVWPKLCRAVRGTALVLSVWASIVACRRPLEGAVTVCGNVALVCYLVTFLMEFW